MSGRPVTGALENRHLVLIGLMGVGKTTVGQVLADRLGRELVDSDVRIEMSTGKTVKQILDDHGVDELRRLESAALFDALAERVPKVIAAAGGVVLATDHRRRLQRAGAHIVWLEADPETLGPRTLRRRHRPLAGRRPFGHTATYARRTRAAVSRGGGHGGEHRRLDAR